MAKMSIHIPDEILSKIQPHKDRMNISKVCSNALMREVEVLSSVPPMVEETRKLIDKLRSDMNRQQVDSFNMGVSLGRAYLSKVSIEQLRFWSEISVSENRKVTLPEGVEEYIERGLLEHKFKHPFHRVSFNKGWLSVMKRSWETVKDKV